MEDDLNGRRPQWKTTLMEDNLMGRQPQWKTTLMEDNLNGRRPQWKMTQWKTTSYNLIEAILTKKIAKIV